MLYNFFCALLRVRLLGLTDKASITPVMILDTDMSKRQLGWFWGAHSKKTKSSVDSYTSIKCQFRQSFRESVIRWFNSKKNSNLLPSLKESVFGLSENSPNNSCLTAKLNYTLLFMRFYIYSCKIRNKALTLRLCQPNRNSIPARKILSLINSI